MKSKLTRFQVKIAKEFVAELLGTAVLLMFGCGCVAQAVLSRNVNGNMFSINVGWGLGVLIGIIVAGPISGAHLNPAVSVALAVVGKFPLRSLLHYLPAQYIGAWLGSALVLLTYRDALNHYYDTDNSGQIRNWGLDTVGIFVTSPNEGVSNIGGAIDQVVGTALLLLGVSAVGYSKNSKVSSIIGPLIVAFVVMAIGICFGHNAGYAINPARDLGPRIMTWMFGWGNAVWKQSSYWWWIPVVCCHVGGVIGALLHLLLIEWTWDRCGDYEDTADNDRDVTEKEEASLKLQTV